MSQRRTHRHADRVAGSGVASDPVRTARIRSLLAAGKTRDAPDLAKAGFKRMRSADAEALLVEAYEAPVWTLMGQGMHREAQALAMAARRFPGIVTASRGWRARASRSWLAMSSRSWPGWPRGGGRASARARGDPHARSERSRARRRLARGGRVDEDGQRHAAPSR